MSQTTLFWFKKPLVYNRHLFSTGKKKTTLVLLSANFMLCYLEEKGEKIEQHVLDLFCKSTCKWVPASTLEKSAGCEGCLNKCPRHQWCIHGVRGGGTPAGAVFTIGEIKVTIGITVYGYKVSVIMQKFHNFLYLSLFNSSCMHENYYLVFRFCFLVLQLIFMWFLIWFSLITQFLRIMFYQTRIYIF